MYTTILGITSVEEVIHRIICQSNAYDVSRIMLCPALATHLGTMHKPMVTWFQLATLLNSHYVAHQTNFPHLPSIPCTQLRPYHSRQLRSVEIPLRNGFGKRNNTDEDDHSGDPPVKKQSPIAKAKEE